MTPNDDEYTAGRSAARLSWQLWPDHPEIADPRTPAFAAGALDELVEIQHKSAGVDKEVRRYAEASAEQLTADPFHGILEIREVDPLLVDLGLLIEIDRTPTFACRASNCVCTRWRP